MKIKLLKTTIHILNSKKWDKRPHIENRGYNIFLKRYIIYVYY